MKTINKEFEKQRKNHLLICLLLDAIGMISYILPFFGEAFDVFWAPVAAFASIQLFKGKLGLAGGAFTFIEEAMPGLDFIPSFTITWFVKYVWSKKSTYADFTNEKLQTIKD